MSVLLGNGDGTFQPQVTYAVGIGSDADRGGRLQRRRPARPGRRNFGDDSVSVLLGNGDGTFQPRSSRDAVGVGPDAIVAGDFNGDGRLDLAVANYGANDVSVLLGNGDGTFQPQVTYAVGVGPDAHRGGRLQRRRPARPGRRQLRVDDTVSVLLGNGDGTFQPQVTYAVGSVPGSPSWRATSTATAALDLAVVNETID